LAIALCAIGLAPPVLAVFAVAAGAFSFFLSATTGMTYGVIADSFPPLVRATGVGVVMGISRFASALGPALGGWMFAAGLTRAEVSVGFAALPVLAALLMIRLPNRRSGVLVGREPAAPGLTPAP
ncbi:MAG: hypothetical protein PSX79_00020, partial [bacterium]|nr:hypothetical protein [bacterium]